MGKIKKHTEYYCDLCGSKIVHTSFPFPRDRFYKIKQYDYKGNRRKIGDYFVCDKCLTGILIEMRLKGNKKGE